MKIGIDAMGGDFAPEAIVEGVVMAASDLPENAHIVLIGKQDIINNLLSKYNYKGSQIEIVHADEVVEMGESCSSIREL